jgi:hypothetical protein
MRSGKGLIVANAEKSKYVREEEHSATGEKVYSLKTLLSDAQRCLDSEKLAIGRSTYIFYLQQESPLEAGPT